MIRRKRRWRKRGSPAEPPKGEPGTFAKQQQLKDNDNESHRAAPGGDEEPQGKVAKKGVKPPPQPPKKDGDNDALGQPSEPRAGEEAEAMRREAPGMKKGGKSCLGSGAEPLFYLGCPGPPPAEETDG